MTRNGQQISGVGGMWIVAAGITIIYILSTLPTPLYVLYRQAFHFSQITLTLVYAIYVLGTIVTMFFLGRLADQIGRQRVVLVALLLAAAGAGVFLLAHHTAWLFPARILSGLAIALAAGASTAWVTELEPHQDKGRATEFVIVANLLGLGLGAVVAGTLAQYTIWPLRVPYFVFLGLLAPIAFLIWRVKETTHKQKSLADASLEPRLGVPHELRGRFVAPAICAFAVFSVMGFYTALIPSLLTQTFKSQNHALSGAIVAELFIVGMIAVILLNRVQTRTGLIWGLALLLPSVGLLIAAQAFRSMPILLFGTAVSGVATALGYRYSLQAVTELAPPDKKSEIVSTYLIACYCGISLPIIGIGVMEKFTNPMFANSIFAGVIALFAVVALVIQWIYARKHQELGSHG